MKTLNILLASFFLFIFNPIFAQISIEPPSKTIETEVGKFEDLASFWASCSKYTNDSIVSYTFFFKNIEYQTIVDIKSFSFMETGNDYENFYNTISENLKVKEEKRITINLPKGTLFLEFGLSMGKTLVAFVWNEDGVSSTSRYFNQKQIDKIFGKK
jgi:hypothetical protein